MAVKILEKMLVKLVDALSTVWGWLLLLVGVIIDFVGGNGTAVLFVVLAVVVDAGWGITVSIKQKRFAKSELMRDSLSKLAVYGTVLFMFISVDKLITANVTLTTSVVSSLIILVELWSASASMLICYPNMPFLKLMRKALKGEIARKLSINEDDVNKALGYE